MRPQGQRERAKTSGSAERAGLDQPTPAMMELKLIQSKAEIESPQEGVQAKII